MEDDVLPPICVKVHVFHMDNGLLCQRGKMEGLVPLSPGHFRSEMQNITEVVPFV